MVHNNELTKYYFTYMNEFARLNCIIRSFAAKRKRRHRGFSQVPRFLFALSSLHIQAISLFVKSWEL